MRLAILCTAVALLSAAELAAAQEQQWGFVKSDPVVTLFFGVPESDAGTLYVVCDPGAKKIDIVTRVLPRKAGKGRVGKIGLSNDSARLEYAGRTVQENEDSGIHFEASTTIDPRLFDLLGTGMSLRIEVLGARERVSLAGVARPLAQMREACR
jgi:hypothetical protein